MSHFPLALPGRAVRSAFGVFPSRACSVFTGCKPPSSSLSRESVRWTVAPAASIRLSVDNLEGSSQEPQVYICSQEDSLGKGSWKSCRLEMVKRKRQGRLGREGAAWTMKASKTRGGHSWQCGDLKALGFLRDGLCSCAGLTCSLTS